MTEQLTYTELAQRSSSGMEVTLLWLKVDDGDKTVVCVSDTREGAYFEIETELHLALDVYYHPHAYRDASMVDYEDRRLAA